MKLPSGTRQLKQQQSPAGHLKYMPLWNNFLWYLVFRGLRACDRKAKAQRKEKRNQVARKQQRHGFSNWVTQNTGEAERVIFEAEHYLTRA